MNSERRALWALYLVNWLTALVQSQFSMIDLVLKKKESPRYLGDWESSVLESLIRMQGAQGLFSTAREMSRQTNLLSKNKLHAQK